MSKDLLLPFREQERPVRAGETVVVYVLLDPKSQRIVATSRLPRHLNRTAPAYKVGQAVGLTIVCRTPLGYNVIVEGAHMGLLFQNSTSAQLEVGQKLKGFVRAVRGNGKIDVSLDESGYKRVGSLTEQIVQVLERSGGRSKFDDDSSPESIRSAFGVSKKAFKQALGSLYKERRIAFRNPGIELLEKRAAAPPPAKRTEPFNGRR